MNQTIWNLTGTPQETVNWQNPDEWIPERLTGDVKDMAQQIHSETGINPRYVLGSNKLMANYSLIEETTEGVFSITERGKIFASSESNEMIKKIDEQEGCLFILYLTSIHPGGTRKTFLPEWRKYLKENSNYKSDSVVKNFLGRRLANLMARSLVYRDGISYYITEVGKKYLQETSSQFVSKEISEEQNLTLLINEHNEKQKQQLKEQLHNVSPQKFEYIIRDLLEAMNYQDLEVTSLTNDKGVDVIGTIQNGITTVKEVVQVKRFRNNIQRPVIDQLRGSLHRFQAFRGTVITLSDFSRGAKEASLERGAAPITLIDGKKLIDLIFEHETLVVKKDISYYTLDTDSLLENGEGEDLS
ncbi:restriction endonuclease [Bacillus sp. FJAT-44742]|uniref:restriction endonuclease n=1 Tax=Bacillus sp. FJAT-44742 TaxID=2014005 RepID=UPI0018E1E2F3|nr:restriction endonuclease [Bacillus sp. FJAT-44742]